MKKILSIIISILLCASVGWGDEVDDGLPDQATEQIRTRTRAMINAGVPEDEAIQMTRMMVQNQFQHKNTLRAQQVVIDAVEQGLPADPVVRKAYEGMAKNIPEDRVIQAMEKTQHRYAYAYRHTKEFAQNSDQADDMGKALAQGLTAGVTEQDADRTMDMLRQRTREMKQIHAQELAEESILSLRSMARRGVPSETASEVVCQALQNRYTAQEMRQMRQSFKTNSKNTEPARLAHQYALSIREGGNAENLGSSKMGGFRSTSGRNICRNI